MYITCEDDVVQLVLYSVHSYLPIGPRGRGRLMPLSKIFQLYRGGQFY
jgi:hypothetical protein